MLQKSIQKIEGFKKQWAREKIFFTNGIYTLPGNLEKIHKNLELLLPKIVKGFLKSNLFICISGKTCISYDVGEMS